MTGTVLVTGASGVVGHPLCDRLRQTGVAHIKIGRSVIVTDDAVRADLAGGGLLTVPAGCFYLVHAAPLWLLPEHLERFACAGIRRVVAFSSSSVLTKRNCASQKERALVSALEVAEKRLWEIAAKQGLDVTVFRPTMIYGFGRDRNITLIANLIRRLSFFPVAGRASGLRQPVQSLDLTEAVMHTLDNASTFGNTYNLGGGERLSYTAMVERIFHGLGRTPRVLHLPEWLYRGLLSIAAGVGWANGLSPAAAARMNEDLCFDNAPATRDFAYQPAAFLDHPLRDLAGAKDSAILSPIRQPDSNRRS